MYWFQLCRRMITRAHVECVAGISRARNECSEATALLGTMYLRTKEFLDQTNLEKYAPDHVREQHLIKRQILIGGTAAT